MKDLYEIALSYEIAHYLATLTIIKGSYLLGPIPIPLIGGNPHIEHFRCIHEKCNSLNNPPWRGNQ